MFRKRYATTNKGKKYMTDRRKDGIKIARFVMVLVALIITPALASFVYTLNYNVVSTAHAQVPRTETKELTLYQQISEATNGENVDVIYNLCKAESWVWINKQPPCQKFSVNKNSNGTYDYSYFQINDVHIKGRPASKGKGTITMECVYDLDCSAKWVNEKIKQGKGNIWVSWGKI